jgi:hypothetical protein
MPFTVHTALATGYCGEFAVRLALAERRVLTDTGPCAVDRPDPSPRPATAAAACECRTSTKSSPPTGRARSSPTRASAGHTNPPTTTVRRHRGQPAARCLLTPIDSRAVGIARALDTFGRRQDPAWTTPPSAYQQRELDIVANHRYLDRRHRAHRLRSVAGNRRAAGRARLPLATPGSAHRKASDNSIPLHWHAAKFKTATNGASSGPQLTRRRNRRER